MLFRIIKPIARLAHHFLSVSTFRNFKWRMNASKNQSFINYDKIEYKKYIFNNFKRKIRIQEGLISKNTNYHLNLIKINFI
jgi:hypothetical protein